MPTALNVCLRLASGWVRQLPALLAVHPARCRVGLPTHPPPLPACVPAWLQALLPEALIPLALLAPPPASIGAPPASWGAVLCGDPRQLGPVVRSQVGGWCS